MKSSEATPVVAGSMPWYRDITAAQWRVLAAAWGVWVMDAVDFLAITFVLRDIASEFNVPLSTASLLLFATYGVRWIGGLMFGSLSDRIGRKIPLVITLVWFTGGAVLTGMSWSFVSLAVFRLLLGFGMAPGFSLGATMVAESWPERHRAIGIGILDTGWGLGAIGAAIAYDLVYPHFGWRGMFFVGVIPALLLVVFILLFVPESQAFRKGAKHVRVPLRDNPAVILFRRYPKRVGYLALLMLVLCFGSWPFQGLFPTYLKSLSFEPLTITWLTMTSAVGQVFGFFASGFIAERLGRRAGISAMLGAGALSVVALVYSVNYLLLAECFAFLSGFFLVGSSGIWGTILTENLPREVRASGVGFLYNIGVVGGGIAPYIVLSTVKAASMTIALGIAVFTIVAALAAIVILRSVRETKGMQLSEIDGGGH
ncbi:MFS transporter [Caballeronia mineralivorans PML1(12)]|uniref:MFS transporter n=1 Tax=Caballeronia mineralivorans PML1(12) TaxID=908627 RepID=A0A0J1CXE2_9BURK|nr:MFS transporter [Caballeronia mineralivorans]KLU25239.1 MFS transporter [Caballeronia mineralivorans PML1(12)]